MTIAHRLRLNVLVCAGMVMIIGLASVLAIARQREAAERGELADRLMQGAFELAIISDYYLRHPEEGPKAQWQLRHSSLLQALEEMHPEEDVEYVLVTRMGNNLGTMAELFAELVATQGQSPLATPEPARDTAREAKLEQLADLLAMRSREVSTDAARLAIGSDSARERIGRDAGTFIIFTASALLLVVLWSSALLGRSIAGPLGKLHAGVEIIGAGNFDHRTGISSKDEIGELSRAFDRMTAQLQATTVSRDELGKEVEERRRAEAESRKLSVDLARRNAELAAANRELEGFAYSVSHDLRTPLRAIDGFSLALLEDYGDRLDSEGRDYLRRVRAASQRTAKLIDDLLTLTRITRSEMKREMVDLSALAGAVAAGLREREPGRQAEFVIEENLAAVGDLNLLRGLLEKLLENAWKFSGRRESARIEFGRTEADGSPAFFVRDNGAGFDMAYAGKLFGAFQRLHSEEEFSGTGIGLAMVQRIVLRHGGRIWAAGAVDRGATFYFTLP